MKRYVPIWVAVCMAVLMAFLAASCSNRDSTAAFGTTYTVGGSVNGVSITGLKLTNNGKDEITLNSAGTFSFPAGHFSGSAYNVQVSQDPTGPAQTCTVSGNTGVIAGANITDVNVVCSVLALSIIQTTNTGPGQTPTVEFQVRKNNAPLDILATPLQFLSATIAGPTTDYASSWQAKIQGAGQSGTLIAVDAPNGIFQYTLPSTIPISATGSYAIGLEAYLLDGAYPGVEFGALSPVQFFAVTDAVPVARRAVVEDAKCNACHAKFSVHGGYRRSVQSCAFCHNPNASNDTWVSRFETGSIVSPSMDLKVLIHKIHRGAALTQPYIVYGFPAPSTANPAGAPIDFGTVVYPGDLRACKTCHLPGTYNIPLAAGLLPSTEREFTCNEDPAADTNSYCGNGLFVVSNTFQKQPTAAACTSCHDASYTAAHVVTMTTPAFAESCATCHAAGAANGIDVYHILTP